MKKFSQFRKINEQELSLSSEKEEVKEVGTQSSTQESKPEEGEVTKSEPSKFFSKIFEARQMAHIYHLQVKGDNGSYAAHTALNDFYDGILNLLDELIETYQGQYDIIENYDLIDTKETSSKDKISYFTEFAQFNKDTRKKAILEEDTHLHNIIDEIVAMTYKLLYKLRFNK